MEKKDLSSGLSVGFHKGCLVIEYEGDELYLCEDDWKELVEWVSENPPHGKLQCW